VYVYYQLDNFYQNHRRYVKSRDSAQLNGKYKAVSELNNCDPIITVGDLWEKQKISVSGKALKADAPAIPCGLVAKSVFNDTYTLKLKTSPDAKDGKKIDIDQNNIAWSSDVAYKFNNIQDPPEGKTW
jgi:hypothetical protein